MKTYIIGQGVSAKLKFNGKARTRMPIALIMISGQAYVCPPICVSAMGNGFSSEEISEAELMVSSNSSNISGGTGIVTIPAGVGGDWGNICVLCLVNTLEVSKIS